MATIGSVSIIPMETNVLERSHHIEWKILDFTSISVRDNYYVSSPSFSFAGESWKLRIYPNGYQAANSVGYIGLYLGKVSSGASVKLEYSLGLKTLNGKKFLEHYRTYTFKKENGALGVHKFSLRSDLFENTSVFSSTDPLTLFCNLNYPKADVNGNHEFLCQDYKKVLLGGRNHDLILKVGNRELRAHQDILRARSRVFESMLDHNMKEKNSGVIDIPDCKPHAMEQFLSYVYCGEVETLDQSNMLELYYIADKYEMMGLKVKCANFIKNSLSLTNICDVIQLALNHSDSDVLEHATNYFIENVLDIMYTVEWQSFMEDNSTVANELLIKAFKKIKK